MTYSALWSAILDAIRLTAALAGMIVIYDAGRDLAGLKPMQFGTRRESAFKWLLGGVAAVAFGLSLFAAGPIGIIARGTLPYQLGLSLGWICLATMMVLRARVRVYNRLAVDAALFLTFVAALCAGLLDRGL